MYQKKSNQTPLRFRCRTKLLERMGNKQFLLELEDKSSILFYLYGRTDGRMTVCTVQANRTFGRPREDEIS